jgi:endonuclease I
MGRSSRRFLHCDRHHGFALGVAFTVIGLLGCSGDRSDDDSGTSESELRKRKPPTTGSPSPPQSLAARYATLSDLNDGALKSALYDLVKDHRALGYDGARDVLLNAREFVGSDGKLECIYTGRRQKPDGSREPGEFNTEHTWPQSLGAEHEPARSDLHHIFPVYDRANSARNNHLYGVVGCLHGKGTCAFSDGGSALGDDDNGDLAFEVRAETRGDVARAHFYFSVRYRLHIGAEEEATLRSWHRDDPVDGSERARNDAIEALQANRNPFVDRPGLVSQISDF